MSGAGVPLLPARTRAGPWRRRAAGLVLLVLGLPLLTAALLRHRDGLAFATPVLLVLVLVAGAASLGGLWVGLPGALAGAGVLNWYFTRPYGTFDVEDPQQLLVLGVFLGTALAVSALVERATATSAAAARARAEAAALTSLAGTSLAEQATLHGVLERVRQVFGMREAVLVERGPAGWTVVESTQDAEPAAPEDREVRVAVGEDAELVVRGPELFAEDRRVLTAFAEVAGTALAGRRLAARAAESAQLEAVDRARTALLAAAGHDLRTPLAAIKAAASSLRHGDIAWTGAERDELLRTVEESADRMQALVDNLLDASRLQAGAVTARFEAVSLEEVVLRALMGVGPADRVHVQLPEDLPDVRTDPGLAERVLANLVQNALRYSPAGTMVAVRATHRDGRVRCEVVDHGPGLPDRRWPSPFTPLRRLGDRSAAGLGLGLVVATGFAEAIGAILTPAETPGGGLTARLDLPVAPVERGAGR